MSTIVFLIFWLPGTQLPTAKFITSFETMEQCTRVKEAVKDEDIKPHLTCFQVVAALPDAKDVI